MKFLRNPVVSGILAVVAVLVVAYQFVGANIHFRLGGTAGKVVNAIAPALAPPAPAPQPLPPKEVAEAAPDPTIDRSYLEGRFAKWVVSPLRDPFLLFSTDPKEKSKDDEESASPISKWHLNGI